MKATDRNRARATVMMHGWNSVCYQILNPGFRYWFDPNHQAVVGYVNHAGYWVVGGAPVCAKEDLPHVSRAFSKAAKAHNCKVLYFGAGYRLYDEGYKPPQNAVVALGAQPVWNPVKWHERVYAHASVRAQINRARNKQGIDFRLAFGNSRESPGLARVSC